MSFLSGEKATAEFNIDLSIPREGATSGWSKATKQILQMVVGENSTKKGGRGALVWKYKDKAPEIKANDGWNHYRITASGSKLKQELNGAVTIEFDDKDPTKAAKHGVLALQYHSPGGFEVRFRDIKIKLLENDSLK